MMRPSQLDTFKSLAILALLALLMVITSLDA